MKKTVIYVFKANDEAEMETWVFETIEEMFSRDEFKNASVWDIFKIKIFKSLDALEQWQLENAPDNVSL